MSTNVLYILYVSMNNEVYICVSMNYVEHCWNKIQPVEIRQI